MEIALYNDLYNFVRRHYPIVATLLEVEMEYEFNTYYGYATKDYYTPERHSFYLVQVMYSTDYRFNIIFDTYEKDNRYRLIRLWGRIALDGTIGDFFYNLASSCYGQFHNNYVLPKRYVPNGIL